MSQRSPVRNAARPRTREQELRAAIKKSGLSYAAREMFRALLDSSDWATGHIPEDYQPKSLPKLAEKAGMSLAHAKRALNELEDADWIVRHRVERPGRGDRTMYELRLGAAKRKQSQATPGAERTRLWRQRKGAHDSVTEGAQDSVTRGSGTRHKGAQVTSHMPRSEGVRPGGREGGSSEGPAAADLVRCQFCHAWGGGELGPIQHADGCWTGEMWKIYEAEL